LKAITDKIIKSDFVNWRNLEIIQPKGFKELSKLAYQKLRNSIIENNFVESFKVWENGKIYCLDGVHRCKVLDILDSEGYDIPDKFRADFIECKDKKQAKKMILVYSSRYAKLLEEGLYEFVQDLNWDEITKVVDFADIDIDRFTDGYMRDTEGLIDEDEIPEVTEAITKTGDLWLLGDNRVLCGDATKKEDVERLMDGKKAGLIFTDPPYNVNYGDGSNPKYSAHIAGKHKKIEGDNQTKQNWVEFNQDLALVFRFISEGDVYIWGAPGPDGMRQRLTFIDTGIHWSATIIWKKQQFVMSAGKYQRIYEVCFYGWIEGRNSSFVGDRKQVEMWSIDRAFDNKLHPTMKPVELCVNGIKNSSKAGFVVWDGFLGSGSTLIACEKTNRKCYGLEIDKHYCDVIVKRWEDFTGKKGILDG